MKAKKKKKKASQVPCTHWVVPVEQLKDSDELFVTLPPELLRSVEQLKDSDELFVTLPPELLRSVDWKEGDVIIWSPDKDGYFLTKVEKH